MDLLLITQLLALAALLFAIAAFARRWQAAHQRPLASERAPAKGSPARGVWYAFTLGMAPWAKESTRRHPIAYLRGIAFHVGIFAGLSALLLGPLWAALPPALRVLLAAGCGFGALMGLAGALARRAERDLRALSTPDDYFAVLLVTLYLALAGVALLDAAWLPAMYVAGALLLVYMPLGKIRHCLYFFFSRRFFGLFIGRRDVLHSEVTR
jgi:hypothetical protein